MTLTQDRRKESRVEMLSPLTLDLLDCGSAPVTCIVKNMSRLGVGFECSMPLKLDSSQSATLNLNGKQIEIKLSVRLSEFPYFGAEFLDLSPENAGAIRKFLSPSYVASSIESIGVQHLLPHVLALYRGLDFECILFRSGLSGAEVQMQFLWKGRIVEILDDKARFVPRMLARESGPGASGVGLVKCFIMSEEQENKRELKSFFSSIESVLNSWELCPVILHSTVRKQLALVI